MNGLPRFISITFFLASLTLVRGAASEPAVEDLSPLLDRLRAEQKLPAVAALIIENGRVTARGAAGVRKLGDPSLAQIGDRWHLGSCTKTMTATMIAVLVERKVLRWNTTIEEALPDLKDGMRPEYRAVTIEQLLAHRGGIRHEWDVPGLWDVLWKREGTPVEERRRMTKAMLSQEPKVAVGEYFYSNCGYAIAGHMAETATGKPWEQLMRELVFEPLGMKSAGFGVPWDAEPPVEPWPHRGDSSTVAPGLFADNPPSIGPGGTIHASLDDWSKFIAEHLKGSGGKDGVLLKAATYRRLQTGRKIGDGPDEYALGWQVLTRPWAKGARAGSKGRCLHHGGSNNSWFALVWIAPERNMAILCATNIGGDGVFPRIDAVVAALIQGLRWERIAETGLLIGGL